MSAPTQQPANEVDFPPHARVPVCAPVSRPPRGRGRTPKDLFLDLLDANITDAAIHFIIDGEDVVAGNAALDGPDSVVLAIHRNHFFARVLGEGNLGLGEAFMDGDVTVERGEMWQFLTTLLRGKIDR
ncbi:MAG: hypothetical protein ABI442_13665, partial [Gemmatimonadaceae bacterium]